jgi:hypothetical protein
MNSITAVLAWDYLRRNRRLLLLFAFLANIPFILIVLPMQGINFSDYSYVATPIVTIVTWCITLTIVFGVMITQRQLGGLYFKPITSLAIAAHCFWFGAIAVTSLMAAVVGFWKWLVVPDFPVAWPLLFGLVSWGVSQPWFCVGVKSMRSIVIALVLIVVLCSWYASRLGLVGYLGEGRRNVIWFEAVPSAMDVAVGAVAIALGFVLSVWRVTRDRSGRHSLSLLSRLGDAWERWQTARWSIPSRPLASPADAYETFVFRSRAIAVPATIVTVLAMAWIAALFVGAISRTVSNTLVIAMTGCWVAAQIQVLVAAAVAILTHLYFSKQARSPVFGSDRRSSGSLGPYSTRFFETLPIATGDIAGATLRASLTAVSLSTVALTGSVALVGLLIRLTDTEVSLMNDSGVGLATMSLATTFGSAFVSYVLLNIPFAISALAATQTIWLAVTSAFGISLFLHSLFYLLTGVPFLIWLLAEMVFFTVLSLRRGDVTPRSAVLIWGAGAALTVVVSLLAATESPDNFGAEDVVKFSFAAALAILPFLSTPIAVRRFRVS